MAFFKGMLNFSFFFAKHTVIKMSMSSEKSGTKHLIVVYTTQLMGIFCLSREN